jgi:hypothetical protein
VSRKNTQEDLKVPHTEEAPGSPKKHREESMEEKRRSRKKDEFPASPANQSSVESESQKVPRKAAKKREADTPSEDRDAPTTEPAADETKPQSDTPTSS